MRSTLSLFALALAASAPALAAEAVPVSPFTSIELRGGGSLELRRGPVQRVTIVEGSSQYTHVYVRSEQRLRIDACNARCPQHYQLRIVVESPTVPILAVQGGGTITTTPGFSQQKEMTLAVGGGGAIDARAVPSDVVTAAVSGGGSIRVQPRNVLTAAVNGGGEIRYWGNPSVTTAIQGGGTVRPGG